MKLKSSRGSQFFYVDWWLMNHCNYNCSYCSDLIKSGSIDLPNIAHCKDFVIEVEKFARQQQKTCSYYFTGGEVTQWPWLTELLQHIQPYGSRVGIRTNASMPVQAWNKLCEYLTYANLEIHSEHTQLSHFMLCLSAAKKNNVSVNITVNMLPERWQEIEELIEKIKTLWPEQNVHRKMLFEDPAINKMPLEYTPVQQIKLKRQSGELIITENGIEEFTDFQTLILEGKNKFTGYKCSAGIEQLIVDAWGRVKRGHCNQGGLVGKIGEGYIWSSEPVICKAEACRNGFDINATKY
jgi:pyruvate-formate lyase-activating enzyme